jgi:hypothetical protein
MGYLFYRFYKGYEFIGKNKNAELPAYYIFSIILNANLYSIVQVFILTIIKSEVSIPSIYLVIFAASIFGLNLFLFIRKDKYKSLIEKYKNETNVQHINGIVITWLYVITSIVLFFYSKVSIDLLKITN